MQFSLSAHDVENGAVPIVMFGCPKCDAYTAVTKRTCGGILIERDKHATESATPSNLPGA
jgi:hypothetical protein